MWAANNDHFLIVKYLMEQYVAIEMTDKVRAGEDIYAMLYW